MLSLDKNRKLMSIKYESIPKKSIFNIKKEYFTEVKVPWHVHVEYELAFIKMAMGSKHIGSSFEKIVGEELLMVGPYLPHNWQNFMSSEDSAKDYQIVIHFDRNVFGHTFFDLPPFSSIKELLRHSESGISFDEETTKYAGDVMEKMLHMNEFDKCITLLNLLKTLSTKSSFEKLSNYGYRNADSDAKMSRMNEIFRFINLNYDKKITLKELADIANMVPQAFCTYFKSRTGKTPVEFVNEVRITHACNMLCAEDINIEKICYDTGFNSISNFNKQFKKVIGMSPKEFQQKIRT